MGEHLTPEQLARTGWRFHFNNDTLKGRRNVRIWTLSLPKNLFLFAFFGRREREEKGLIVTQISKYLVLPLKKVSSPKDSCYQL